MKVLILLTILLGTLFLATPVYANPPWAGPDEDYDKIVIIEKEVVVEKLVFADDTEGWYIPFKSVEEIYNYALRSEVPYREYKQGVYDCINYEPPDRYFGFALDFIREARLQHRYFITDYVPQGSGKWHMRVMAFVGNRLYALDQNNLTKYPVLLGYADR